MATERATELPSSGGAWDMPSLAGRGLLALGAVILGACKATEPAAQKPATVRFVLDAPLCSSSLPVQFFIDSVMVGADVFRVHLAPDHTVSSDFGTTAGRHVLDARVVGGYVWPSTVVALAPGGVFADTLPFYCS
jgi:hypothetical protein